MMDWNQIFGSNADAIANALASLGVGGGSRGQTRPPVDPAMLAMIRNQPTMAGNMASAADRAVGGNFSAAGRSVGDLSRILGGAGPVENLSRRPAPVPTGAPMSPPPMPSAPPPAMTASAPMSFDPQTITARPMRPRMGTGLPKIDMSPSRTVVGFAAPTQKPNSAALAGTPPTGGKPDWNRIFRDWESSRLAHREPDADQYGGPSDMDADNLSSIDFFPPNSRRIGAIRQPGQAPADPKLMEMLAGLQRTRMGA